MKVFRIRLDSNVYQGFLPTDTKVWETSLLKMDCQPKLTSWQPPEVYIQNPKRKPGNFLHLCSGAFVVDFPTGEKLRTTLEMAGELLPLPHQGKQFYLLNVLECVNCLDGEQTKWAYGKRTNARIGIEEYRFHTNRFSESTLFKIPETAMAEVLTVTGLKDPEDEFKPIIEHQGLQGLLFEEVWSSKPG